jgi:hypothetical protein
MVRTAHGCILICCLYGRFGRRGQSEGAIPKNLTRWGHARTDFWALRCRMWAFLGGPSRRPHIIYLRSWPLIHKFGSPPSVFIVPRDCRSEHALRATCALLTSRLQCAPQVCDRPLQPVDKMVRAAQACNLIDCFYCGYGRLR